MGGLFKWLLIGSVLFGAYNEFIFMRRESTFNKIAFHQLRPGIEEKLGIPVGMHRCATDPKPSQLMYADTLCKEAVEEVAAYQMCLLPPRCKTLTYVAYDQKGRMLLKYNMAQ